MIIHEIIAAIAAIETMDIDECDWEPLNDEAAWCRAGTLEDDALRKLFIVRLQWWKEAQKLAANAKLKKGQVEEKLAFSLFLKAHLKWNLVDSLLWNELRLALPHLRLYQDLAILPNWEIAFKE